MSAALWNFAAGSRVVEVRENDNDTGGLYTWYTRCPGPRAEGEGYVQIGPISSGIFVNPHIDVVYLPFPEVGMVQDFMRVDIQLLALDSYWFKQTTYQIGLVRYLSEWIGIKVVFVVVNTTWADEHTGDERFVAPESAQEIVLSYAAKPALRSFQSLCQHHLPARKVPVLRAAVVRRGSQTPANS